MIDNINKNTVVYSIIQKILLLIQTGNLNPGDKLPSERTFANTLNVSRSSLRTAYKHLHYNKILITEPSNGTFVAPEAKYLQSMTNDPTIEHLLTASNFNDEVFINRMECRIIIEPKVAKLAALYRSEKQLAKMENIIKRMENSTRSSYGGSFYIDDTEFHKCIAEASGNKFLEDIVKNYCVRPDYHIYSFGSIPNLPNTSLLQHKKIFEAIKDKNPCYAEEMMLKHVLTSYIENSKYVYSNIKIRDGILIDKI